MHNSERAAPIREITPQEQQQFVHAIQALLPQHPNIVYGGQDANLPVVQLPARINKFQVADNMVTVADYPGGDHDAHHIEVAVETEDADTGCRGVAIQTVKRYYVEPEYGHARYDESQYITGRTGIAVPEGPISALDVVRNDIKHIIASAQLAAETGMTVFTPERLSEVMTILGQCGPDNQIS